MNTLDALDADSLRDDIPSFRPGDTVKVHVRVIEGNRSRIQVFQGVVIRRQGGGIRETFFVLRDVVHEVDASGRTELEVLGEEPHRWWTVTEIASSGEEFAPRELAAVLPELLAGPWTGPPRIVD